MVISHIVGGLGNQMFQYAAGRALALRLGEELRLDLTDFGDYALHQGYELASTFGVAARAASEAEIREMLGWRAWKWAQRLSRSSKWPMLGKSNYVRQPSLRYWPGFHQLKGPTYLKGYWQSECYFLDCADAIRSDFTFPCTLSDRNCELAEKIQLVNSISLHVRRGDYVTDQRTASVHGVCSPQYYERAVKYLEERVESPHFFLFSDDIKWLRENVTLGSPVTYVRHNRGAASYCDMHLMSLCDHHIIANSSFSWWGAWLGLHPQKHVVAPKQWFADAKRQSMTEDICPGAWIRT